MTIETILENMAQWGAAIEEGALSRLRWLFTKSAAGACDARQAGLELRAATGVARFNAMPQQTVKDGVCVIPIYGMLMPRADIDDDIWGVVSCERINNEIDAALNNDAVTCVLFDFFSPGGAVIGVNATAEKIRALQAAKPCTAIASGVMCSGAYYLACQCGEIVTTADSINGAIGVFSVAIDLHRMAERAGVEVKVIKAGAMKGSGTPGTEITAEQVAEIQTRVDAFYAQFVDAVAAGRKLPRGAALKMADGRVYVGRASVDAKLVDSVGTYEGTLARLSKATATQTKPQARGLPVKGVQAMTEQEKADAQAEGLKIERKRVADITAAFADDAVFANAQITAGVSVLEAKAAYADVLKGKLATAGSEKDAAVKAATESATKAAALQTSAKPKAGAPAIPTGTGAGDAAAVGAGNAKEQFMAKVAEFERGGAVSRSVAVTRAAKGFPELHRAMVEAANASAGSLEGHPSLQHS